jgi:hypothetical protein
MDARCTICGIKKLTDETERATTACKKCADLTGITPMGPARRPARPCERCNGMQFIRSVPHTPSPRLEKYAGAVAMAVAQELRDTTEFDGRAGLWGTLVGHGGLELYACRRCGFVEWYCAALENVPIGPAYMTEAIDYQNKDAGPFR